MIETRRIDREHKADINIPNEPFRLFGRMVPSYINGRWSYTEVCFPEEQVSEMCFPDENYDYEAMKDQHIFIGAYDGEMCVGLAILQEDMFRYMYLYDLKVSSAYRRHGVGAALMEKSKAVSLERGCRGLYTIGQDNNLGACRFYLKSGFRIGGLNTDVYNGTGQEGKADIYFYWDGENHGA